MTKQDNFCDFISEFQAAHMHFCGFVTQIFFCFFNKGVNCDTEIDECASEPCQNGALCNDHVGFYTCTCAAGYEGAQCEVDINECESQPCQSNGTCHDLIDR